MTYAKGARVLVQDKELARVIAAAGLNCYRVKTDAGQTVYVRPALLRGVGRREKISAI